MSIFPNTYQFCENYFPKIQFFKCYFPKTNIPTGQKPENQFLVGFPKENWRLPKGPIPKSPKMAKIV